MAKYIRVASLPSQTASPDHLSGLLKTCRTIFVEGSVADDMTNPAESPRHIAAYKLNACAAANHQLDRQVIISGPVAPGTTQLLAKQCQFLSIAYSTQPPPFALDREDSAESRLPIVLGGNARACAAAHEIYHSWFARRPCFVLASSHQAELVGLLRAWGRLATMQRGLMADAVSRLAGDTGIPLEMAVGLAFGSGSGA